MKEMRNLSNNRKPSYYSIIQSSPEFQSDAAMNELKKIYWHEKQLLILIPILISGAVNFELVDSLTILLKYTREHVKALEKQFPEIDKL